MLLRALGELLEALLERGSYSERDARTIFKSARLPLPLIRSLAACALLMHAALTLARVFFCDATDPARRGVPAHQAHHAPRPEGTPLLARAFSLARSKLTLSPRALFNAPQLENLLLADKADLSSVRLADFGLAKAPFEEHELTPSADPSAPPPRMRVVCGTPTYVAPEIITGQPYGPGVDMWSAGVILFILLSGVVPFEDPDEQKLFTKIARGAYSVAGPEWVFVSREAKAIVTALLCVAPRGRLTAPAAMAHPWVTQRGDALSATALPAAQGGLKAYATRMKLPARVYPAGAYLIRQGDPATEVLLIRRGECSIILEDIAAEHAGAPAAPRVVARRGAGEFIGEMGVLMDEEGHIVLPGLSEAASRRAGEAAPPAETAAAPAAEQPPAAVADAAAAEALDELRLGEVGASPVPMEDVQKAEPRAFGGGRRTASVRALSEVEVLVLRAKEMQWVLANDSSVHSELLAAVEQRQRELRHAHELNAAQRAARASAAAFATAQ